MVTEWDGTPWAGSTPPKLEVVQTLTAEPEAKAISGPGVAMVEWGIPLMERTNSTRWLKTAQKISHVGWPAVAERLVSGRAAGTAWHLEDKDGNTVDDTSPEPLKAVRDLLSKPMGADLTKRTEGGVRMTQRALWRMTLRHMGVCNVGFWYLSQQELLGGTPLETLYINPARMTPATDKRSNLIGWVLDADEAYTLEGGRINGVPLELDEVIPFWLEPPDWGYYGVGLVESALAKVRLSDSGDRMLTDTFATGGRRGSFISPPRDAGPMPQEVFDALVAGLRNVSESPDSAKRNIVSKGPLEITPQASTPDELQIYEIVSMTRDDILGHWGVPLTQTGIPSAAGLNSGESRKYDEAALWQNAIHPRLDAFRETVQFYLLDRFQAFGIDLKLVLDEPSFDDEAPKYELADKAKVIPLMDNERRALTGHDPLPDFDEVTGEALGVAIRLPKTIVLAAIGPSDEQRPVIQLPTTKPETLALPEGTEEVLEEGEQQAKAGLGIREDIERDITPTIRDRVSQFLREQRSSVLNRLTERAGHLLRRPSDTDAWWSPRRWDHALGELLAEPQALIATQVSSAARERIGGPSAKAEPDDFLQDAAQFVRTRTGERITGINATTRDAVEEVVREVIEDAVEEGLSPDEVAQRLTERVGGLAVWDDVRSELVARTETMFAYNDAALHSYRSLDVTRVQALDGDKDAVCADRNGRIFDVDEAFSIADHPNGTLDWAPVVEGKAVLPTNPQPISWPAFIEPQGRQLVVNIPPDVYPAPVVHIPDTVVHVAAPIVNVEPTPVTVNVPETVVNVAKAEGPLDVRIVESTVTVDINDVSPPKLKRVFRDDKGRIEGVVEGRP